MSEITTDGALAFARASLTALLERPESPLDWVLSNGEARQLTSFVEDLLFTGHTPRQVLQGIREVWATEV